MQINFNNLLHYVKEKLNKRMFKNSVYASPQKINIPLPVSIFLNKNLHLCSQIIAYVKLVGKFS